MTPEEFRRVRAVFEEARIVFGAQRAALLEDVGPCDHPVRAEVEALLSESEQPMSMLDLAVVPPATALRLADEAELDSHGLAGATIDEFRVVRLIGSGSMGDVYEAEQSDPARRVALKVVSTPLGTGDLGRRLRQESAILGRLKHPGIAQIHRAGTALVSHAGRTWRVPFLALELVEGATPITLFAAEKHLSAIARVTMFASVCDAVHHGHQRGVIHRDLKPANILVDSSGQPKIIDFGVARLTESPGALASATLKGQLIGTLAYMAPEQFGGEADIDIRADVYALGAVLLEILGGKPPIDVNGRNLADIAAAATQMPIRTLASLRPDLLGDLDVIVGKALARDRADRYASAAQLADDLRRWLRHEPIFARPPTLRHQLRLLAQRNLGAVAALCGIAATLVVATGVSAGFAVRATREARAATAARESAELGRARAIKVAEFLQGALGSANPYLPTRIPEELLASEFDHWADWRQTPWPYCGKPGRAATPTDILTAATERLDAAFAGDPDSLAKVGIAMGRTLYNLNGPDHGIAALEKAVHAARGAHGDDHETTIRATLLLAEARGHWGGIDRPAVRELYRRALDACARVYGPHDPRTLDALRVSAYDLSVWESAHRPAAEMLLKRVADARAAGVGDTLAILRIESYAAFLLGWAQDFAQADPLSAQTLNKLRAAAGDRSAPTAEALEQRATTLRRAGRLDEALDVQREAASITAEVFGPDCSAAIGQRAAVAQLHTIRGEWVEAAGLYRPLVASYIRLYGQDRHETHVARTNLINALYRADIEPAERIAVASDLIESLETSAATPEPAVLLQQCWFPRLVIADALMSAGDPAGAERFDRMIAGDAADAEALGPLRRATTRYRFADRLIKLGQLARAGALLDEATELLMGSESTAQWKVLSEIRTRFEAAKVSPR